MKKTVLIKSYEDLEKFISKNDLIVNENVMDNLEDKEDYLIIKEENQLLLMMEYLKESICYFNAEWLSEYLTVPEDIISKMQQTMYEESNQALLNLIKNEYTLSEIANDALSVDGFGHFFNGYDGEVYEIEDKAYNTYYIVHDFCFYLPDEIDHEEVTYNE